MFAIMIATYGTLGCVALGIIADELRRIRRALEHRGHPQG